MDVVLITVDSLRQDYRDLLPEKDFETPTINKLKREGVHFENAVSNGAYTKESFPAIHSGTYSWRFGGDQRIIEDRPMVGSLLKEAGFRTFGAHSNPYLDSDAGYDRGFDQFHDTESFSGDSLSKSLRHYISKNIPENSLIYKSIRKINGIYQYLTGSQIGQYYVPADGINKLFTDWYDNNSDNNQFAWVHYMDVHMPYLPHDDTVSEGYSSDFAINLYQKMIDDPDSLSVDEIKALKTLYVGEVEYLDRHLESVLEQTSEDTLVVFTADHGEGFNEHGHFGHPMELYNEIIDIPLYIKHPSLDAKTINSPVSTLDIVPTILGLIGEEVLDEMDGSDLFAEKMDENRWVVSETGSVEEGKCAAYNGEWKLIRNCRTDEEDLFYSIETDVPDDNGKIEESASRKIDEHLEYVSADQHSTESRNISESTKDRLEQLGYRE